MEGQPIGQEATATIEPEYEYAFTHVGNIRTGVSLFPYRSASESYAFQTELYRVSQGECARLREGVPYVKVYLYNPKHLCPKLNG